MDSYEVLGVPVGCDAAAVHRAYRRLAKLHHPDRGGSVAAMTQVNAAYAHVLAALRQEPPRSRRDGAERPPTSPAQRRASVPWSTAAHRWFLAVRLGQWVTTIAVLAAVHAVALASGRSPSPLEGMAALLALRVLAGASPPDQSFAPLRDTAEVVILVVRIALWFGSPGPSRPDRGRR